MLNLTPKGFLFAGIFIQKKKKLGLIYSKKMCSAAGVFTTNQIKAAPVIISQQKIKLGKSQAIIVNSGNANACTGNRGLNDAKKMTKLVAKELTIDEKYVLVASTGIIAQFLPIKEIEKGIKKIVPLLSEKSEDFASSIMTTDTVSKQSAIKIKIDDKCVIIKGIAKGVGMIYPKMATLLCFIITDCAISQKLINKALVEVVNKSFNLITIDGDTSTNDTIFILANGLAKNEIIIKEDDNYKKFKKALEFICLDLSKQIVKDGEGATKFIEIKIKNAESFEQAKKIGMTIANSNLVKTAIFGEDPNFGRIMMAIGNSQVKIEPKKIDLYLNTKKVIKNGIVTEINKEVLRQELKNKEILIIIDLKTGKEKVSVFTTDLSYNYVKINSAYST